MAERQMTLTEKGNILRDKIESALPRIEVISPQGFNINQMYQIFMSGVTRNPELLQCTNMTLINCLLNAAELGLYIGPVLGQCYAVPFRNTKAGTIEATFILGYQGMIELSRRSKLIRRMVAELVYEKDHYKHVKGTGEYLDHIKFGESMETWNGDQDRGQPRLAYSICETIEGGHIIKTMTMPEILAVKDRSRAGKKGPWVTDFDPMACKTVTRRNWKFCPKSTEMGKAEAAEDASEAGLLHPMMLELQDDIKEEIPKDRASEVAERQEKKQRARRRSKPKETQKSPEPEKSSPEPPAEPEPAPQEPPEPEKGPELPKEEPGPNLPFEPNDEPLIQPAGEVSVDLQSIYDTIEAEIAKVPDELLQIVLRNFCEQQSVTAWREVTDENALADLFDRLEQAKNFKG